MQTRSFLLETFINGCSLFFLGVMFSQRGPAFIDLMAISHTSVSEGSAFLAVANFCHMAGSLLTGYTFSKWFDSSLTTAVSLIMCSVFSAFTPYCTSLATMLAAFGIVSLFCGIYETTIQSRQFKLCQGDSSTSMQFLTFCYSVGGIVAPLFTEPFLATRDTNTNSSSSDNLTLISEPGINNSHVLSHPTSWNTYKSATPTENSLSDNDSGQSDIFQIPGSNGSFSGNVTKLLDTNGNAPNIDAMWQYFTNRTTIRPDDNGEVFETTIYYAYLITALIGLAVSIPFIILAVIRTGVLRKLMGGGGRKVGKEDKNGVEVKRGSANGESKEEVEDKQLKNGKRINNKKEKYLDCKINEEETFPLSSTCPQPSPLTSSSKSLSSNHDFQKQNGVTASNKKKTNTSNKAERQLPKKVKIGIIFLASLLYFLYVPMEDCFPHFLSYFVVNELDWSKDEGAMVTSIYWLFSTIIKVIVIYITTKIDIKYLLLFSTTGMVATFSAFTLVAYFHVHWGIWLFAACNALVMSPMYGGGMSWVDSNVMALEETSVAYILIGGSIGAAVVPLPIGNLMSYWTQMAFPYIMLIFAFLNLVLMLSFLFVLKPAVHRRYGSPWSAKHKNVLLLEQNVYIEESEQSKIDGVNDDVNDGKVIKKNRDEGFEAVKAV